MTATLAARQPQAASPVRLVASGTAIVAVSFGLARYGYGLLLPDLGRSLHLTSTALGLIGSTAYLSYLLATAVSSRLISRLGQRATAGIGGTAGTAGMLLIAVASGSGLLAVGVFVAGAAPALVWPPFVDAVERQLPKAQRDRGHGVVNSGTAYGVAVAAPLALLVGTQWRLAWLLFAGLAAAATLAAVRTLPQHLPRQPLPDQTRALRPGALPLLGASLLIGLCGGAYWTFGVDLVTEHHLLGPDGGRLFQILVGLLGIVGGLAGKLLSVTRPSRLFALLAVGISGSELALAHASGPALALTSAVLFGVSYIGIVGVTAIWSALAYPDSPSTGLATSMFCMGVGAAAGPAIAGTIADHAGLPTVFTLAAAIAAGILPFAVAVPSREPAATTQNATSEQPA